MLVSQIAIYSGSFGNLFNCASFFKQFCSNISVVNTVEELTQLDEVRVLVLPGASNTGVLSDSEFESLKQFIKTRLIPSGGKLVGICAGFQIFGKSVSYEGGQRDGLGLIDMDCVRLPLEKSPHFGWYPICAPRSMIKVLGSESSVNKYYFAHAYGFLLDEITIATNITTEVQGNTFMSAYFTSEIFGCQFHPELSGESGFDLMASVFNEWELELERL